MIVTITLTTAGGNTGPFDLYSDSDNYTTPFVTGVIKSNITTGYTSNVVPNNATTIRCKSNNGLCTNSVDLPISGLPSPTSTPTPTPTFTGTSGTLTFYYAGSTEAAVCSSSIALRGYTSTGQIVNGEVIYTNSSLTTPVTGYSYISDNFVTTVYHINSSTGLIGSATGNSC